MDHDEYGHIQRAHTAMVDVSEYINESKRDSELLTIIREIQLSISEWSSNMTGGELRELGGRHRKDGELKVQSHEPNAKTKVRYVFVFDKVMVMCKERTKSTTHSPHFTFKDSLRIADYHVEDVPVVTPANVATTGRIAGRTRESMRWAHSFLIVDNAAANVFTLYTRTYEEKVKWMEAIMKAIDNVLPPERALSDHVLNMSNTAPGAVCAVCGLLMKGLFYQGYQCEVCSLYVHRACIAGLRPCGMQQENNCVVTPSEHGSSINNNERKIIPPELPARPVSMHFTATATFSGNDENAAPLNRQRSTRSLVVTSSGGMTNQQIVETTPPPANDVVRAPAEYINTQMEDHGWYVGEMDRARANTLLMEYPVSTFLVRTRVDRHTSGGGGVSRQLGHAVSLRTDRDVKHMKICLERHEDNTTWYYLSESRRFRSVVELVSYFSRNSLKESFSGLDTILRFSVGELLLVVAKYEFSPALSDKNMLEMSPGERLVVLDKISGNNQGWWKAMKNTRIGYIPKDFVQPVDQANEP